MADREFVIHRDDEDHAVPSFLPLLPLRDVVVFPFMVTPLLVGRAASVAAVEAAMVAEKLLCVVAQTEADIEEPGRDELHDVGTVIKVLQVIRTPDETLKILVEGLARVDLGETGDTGEYLTVAVSPRVEETEEGPRIEALSRSIKDRFKDYVRLNKRLPDEVLLSVLNLEAIDRMADSISGYILGKTSLKQELLAEANLFTRLSRINQILADELEILEIERRIDSEVQSQVQKNQREFYLNEQLRAIRKELGYHSDEDSEVEEYAEKIKACDLPPEVNDAAQRELSRLARMPGMSPEATVVRNYLDTLLELPWKKRSRDRIDTRKVRRQLDADHYGLDKVKDRIIEFLAVYKLTRKMQGSILCLVGPPGVGKTSLGRSIAGSLGRRFVRISLGGVRDEAEIRGHRRTYIGSKPGRIIESLRKAGTRNPVFLLDEIDKLGADYRGDPSAALLEVLDPEQNSHFSDHYLEVDFDLSQVLFITTANSLHAIPPALEDRMEIIRLPGYLEHEKLAIAERFLVPRQLERSGIKSWDAGFRAKALQTIIDGYTREAGVRNLEREIGAICRKVAKHRAERDRYPGWITARNVSHYLGVPRYLRQQVDRDPEVGVVVGLAWTEAGGEILEIETSAMSGSGKLVLTGNLKDVMKESAETALSYARVHCPDRGGDWFQEHQIHVHVPEGAIPKDGPSAGVAMATAMVSLLTDRKVRKDVAMTGEVTLRGKVLPIGGLPEKAVAAVRAGARHLIIPRDNEKEFRELSPLIRKQLTVHLVETMDTVLDLALIDGA
ncbi:MAG TPA: endopeptidase La [Candidatus Krumholzibacteria bacterium]|nr:endopeptidase La [Candidatus Krumholzibacteria bacterium]HPD71162.1 endopeptidase La [Candidatus Krumholzibacteria bacterium]HRY39138.1 endopeptidase La [Candidatus Krumholzibacteria bacterium]